MVRNKEKQRLWYRKNKERILKEDKENYKENKEEILNRNKKWQKDNRKYFYEYRRKWREKKRLKNLKPYTPISEKAKKINEVRFGGLREKVIQRDKEKCQDCGLGREEHKKLYGVDITVHHINNKGRNSKNPEHKMKQLITLCLRCHGKRDALRI